MCNQMVNVELPSRTNIFSIIKTTIVTLILAVGKRAELKTLISGQEYQPLGSWQKQTKSSLEETVPNRFKRFLQIKSEKI